VTWERKLITTRTCSYTYAISPSCMLGAAGIGAWALNALRERSAQLTGTCGGFNTDIHILSFTLVICPHYSLAVGQSASFHHTR
jgi:hypothetical protein